MKKITALSITCLIAVMLTACGSSELSSGSIQNTSEISVWETEQGTEGLSSAASVSMTETPAVSKTDPAAEEQGTEKQAAGTEAQNTEEASGTEEESTKDSSRQSAQEIPAAEANTTSDGAIDASELFTDRDLRQAADTSGAQFITLNSGQDISITKEGVYVLTGTASDVTVTVDAPDDAKVQLVLDEMNITNSDAPGIYVKNADKVFVTTTPTDNLITVSGAFQADGETNTDAAIFAKDDLVLNGTGSLNILSTDNGITCKDDLKITGGTITIECESDALEANDSVAISQGDITIRTNKDGIHAEKEEDDTTGYVYVCGGTLNITAADDGVHGTTIVQIDGGDLNISAAEGIEATWVQINGGTIQVSASDDGINASAKSNAFSPVLEINGGSTTVVMGGGDTDALDSNGNLFINGGTIDITAQSPFDCDGIAQYNGGTMIVNGQETTEITTQFGGPMGGPGGFPGGAGMGPDFGNGRNGGNYPPDYGEEFDYGEGWGEGYEASDGFDL